MLLSQIPEQRQNIIFPLKPRGENNTHPEGTRGRMSQTHISISCNYVLSCYIIFLWGTELFILLFFRLCYSQNIAFVMY